MLSGADVGTGTEEFAEGAPDMRSGADEPDIIAGDIAKETGCVQLGETTERMYPTWIQYSYIPDSDSWRRRYTCIRKRAPAKIYVKLGLVSYEVASGDRKQ